MLSHGLAQQKTAGAKLSPGSPQPSAIAFQLDWLNNKAMHPIDESENIFFVCLFCVWPFDFTSKGQGCWDETWCIPQSASLMCATRTPCGESALTDVPGKVRGAHLAHGLSLLWETWWMKHKDAKVIKDEDRNPALHPLHLKSSLGRKKKQERKYYNECFYRQWWPWDQAVLPGLTCIGNGQVSNCSIRKTGRSVLHACNRDPGLCFSVMLASHEDCSCDKRV